jgi:hypothetical protein
VSPYVLTNSNLLLTSRGSSPLLLIRFLLFLSYKILLFTGELILFSSSPVSFSLLLCGRRLRIVLRTALLTQRVFVISGGRLVLRFFFFSLDQHSCRLDALSGSCLLPRLLRTDGSSSSTLGAAGCFLASACCFVLLLIFFGLHLRRGAPAFLSRRVCGCLLIMLDGHLRDCLP